MGLEDDPASFWVAKFQGRTVKLPWSMRFSHPPCQPFIHNGFWWWFLRQEEIVEANATAYRNAGNWTSNLDFWAASVLLSFLHFHPFRFAQKKHFNSMSEDLDQQFFCRQIWGNLVKPLDLPSTQDGLECHPGWYLSRRVWEIPTTTPLKMPRGIHQHHILGGISCVFSQFVSRYWTDFGWKWWFPTISYVKIWEPSSNWNNH